LPAVKSGEGASAVLDPPLRVHHAPARVIQAAASRPDGGGSIFSASSQASNIPGRRLARGAENLSSLLEAFKTPPAVAVFGFNGFLRTEIPSLLQSDKLLAALRPDIASQE
jgi:hypothetical protein